MIRNGVILGLGAMLLAACVPPQQSQAPNPPAAAEPAPVSPGDMTAKFEPPEGKPLAPVDVRKLTCKTLSGSSDDDKAYATSFLLGYRSALMHSHTIEIKRIEAVEEAALADCVGKPDAMASKVFAAALAKIGPGGEIREPPRVTRHREPPSQATPGGPAPAAVQTPAPSRAPPIEYTPAVTAPTPVQPEPSGPATTQHAPSQVEPGPVTPAATPPTSAAPAPQAPEPASPAPAPQAPEPASPSPPSSVEGHQ